MRDQKKKKKKEDQRKGWRGEVATCTREEGKTGGERLRERRQYGLGWWLTGCRR